MLKETALRCGLNYMDKHVSFLSRERRHHALSVLKRAGGQGILSLCIKACENETAGFIADRMRAVSPDFSAKDIIGVLLAP